MTGQGLGKTETEKQCGAEGDRGLGDRRGGQDLSLVTNTGPCCFISGSDAGRLAGSVPNTSQAQGLSVVRLGQVRLPAAGTGSVPAGEGSEFTRPSGRNQGAVVKREIIQAPSVGVQSQ